jgi:type IV pilus assembly protein PilE
MSASRRGFTLVELVVALSIAAIVTVLATSGYERTVRKARRLDARAALAAVASAQERHYLEYARYASRFDPGVRSALEGDPDAGAEAELAEALPLAPTSPDGYYTLALEPDADALGYVVLARPRGAQQRDSGCAVFTLDDAGNRVARNARGDDVTASCWR